MMTNTKSSAPAVVDWLVSDFPVGYDEAVAFMERRVAQIHQGCARELVWLLEHPSLYTAGTSARPGDLLAPGRFPVFESGRGGQYTYHGPGQRVVYVMLDVKRRGQDVRAFVSHLEGWLVDMLASFNIAAVTRPGRVGLWVIREPKSRNSILHADDGGAREDKIAAIGIRLRKWISYHGLSINVDPELEHFAGIVPCGITGHGVTSMVELGHPVAMSDVDVALKASFERLFGPVQAVSTDILPEDIRSEHLQTSG